MKRTLAGCVTFLLLISATVAVAKKKEDGGSFLIRAPHPMAKIAMDHPSFVGARRALLRCWEASRPCAVTLTFEFGDSEERRHDAIVEIASDGTRSILFREERWTREFSGLGSQITPSGFWERAPRRFTRLERIPLDGSRDTPALPETNASGPEQFRLRFAGEKPTAGATTAVEISMPGGDEGVEIW